ncbi:MAG: serine hydrolase [Pseudomonadota bacterium]
MRRALQIIAFAAAAALMGPLTATASAQPLPDLTLAELEQQIERGDLGKIRAAAARQDGATVYRKRFGGGEMGERVDIKSAGKSITALAIGIAIDEGALPGVDLKVWPYLGEARGAAHNAITIADLLSMSSALDCNDWDKRSPGQEEKMYRKRDWTAFALALPARDYTRDERGIGPFSYCTAGVFLLGQVIVKATGERFDEFLQSRLFDPLGIDGAEFRTSRKGEIQSGGQLTISDEALLKIGQMILDRGKWEGRQIVSESWLKQAFSPSHQLGENAYYGYLFWMMPVRSTRGYEAAFMMKGNGGNIVAIVPTMNAVLVVQAQNYNKREAERNAFVVLTTLLRSLEVPEGSEAEPIAAS